MEEHASGGIEVDDERDVRAVRPDRSDVGLAHVATRKADFPACCSMLRHAAKNRSRASRPSAKANVARRHHGGGTPIHSFPTLLAELAAIVRSTCHASTEDDALAFTVTTQ